MNNLTKHIIQAFCLVLLLFSCQQNTSNKKEKFHNIFYAKHESNVMDLYLCASRNDSTPMMILIHGGAWYMGDKDDFFDELADYLTDNGINAVNMNYAFVSESRNGNHLLLDIDNAINYLSVNKEKYSINTSDLHLLGSSAGGHLALLYAYENHQNIKSVISMAGPTDLRDSVFVHTMKNALGKADLYEQLLGKNQPEELSPLYGIQNVPTLLTHAKDDNIVPFNHSQKLYDSLQAIKIKSQLYIMPEGMHSPYGLNDKYKKEIYAKIKNWIMAN